MPAYDYKCLKCNNIQEEIHSMKSSPTIICNKCKSTKTERMIVLNGQINMGNHPGTSMEEYERSVN